MKRLRTSIPLERFFTRRHDIQHNDIHHKDIQHDDTQHKEPTSDTWNKRHSAYKHSGLSAVMLRVAI